MKIVITGANSSVGWSLLSQLAGTEEDITGLVRSQGAAASLPKAPNLRAEVVGYADADALAHSLQGADCLIHLAGILIESRTSRYQEANVEATATLMRAARAAKVGRLVFVSVIGADPAAANPYHRSKGEAEQLVLSRGIPAAILRTPILLGPRTAGGRALLHTAARGKTRLLGGGDYHMRPLDVDDLVAAILRLCRQETMPTGIFELAGPQTLRYRDLVTRMATRLGKDVRIGSTPIPLARAIAALGFRLRGGGISPAVIDVITMDEHVRENADTLLGLSLTPLDETLSKLASSAAGK